MIENPIFIVGTERSGSNLLRVILNSHGGIVVPHPPHIVRYFRPLEASYGDLARDEVFARFVRDVIRLVRLHAYPWDVPLDPNRVVSRAYPRDAFGVAAELYEQYRESVGRSRWACKSTFMVDHGLEIVRRFADPRIVLLVRDPRDVAVSSRESIFSTYHPYNTAKLWRHQQARGLELVRRLPSTNIAVVRYEELVTDTSAAVRRLCEFLGEAFEPRMLEYFRTDEARKSASLSASWSNTERPPRPDRVARYRELLRAEEVRWVEVVARAEMRAFGYEPVHSDSELDAVEFSPTLLRRFALEEQALRLRGEVRSLRRDRNVGRRWARDLFVWYLRARRGAREVEHAFA